MNILTCLSLFSSHVSSMQETPFDNWNTIVTNSWLDLKSVIYNNYIIGNAYLSQINGFRLQIHLTASHLISNTSRTTIQLSAVVLVLLTCHDDLHGTLIHSLISQHIKNDEDKRTNSWSPQLLVWSELCSIYSSVNFPAPHLKCWTQDCPQSLTHFNLLQRFISLVHLNLIINLKHR